MFIASSQDLFYLVAAIALLWITFFLCWALYEVARLFRRGNALVDEAEEKLHMVEEAVTGVVDKVTNLSNYFSILGEIAKSGIAMVQSRWGEGHHESHDDDELPEMDEEKHKKHPHRKK